MEFLADFRESCLPDYTLVFPVRFVLGCVDFESVPLSPFHAPIWVIHLIIVFLIRDLD